MNDPPNRHLSDMRSRTSWDTSKRKAEPARAFASSQNAFPSVVRHEAPGARRASAQALATALRGQAHTPLRQRSTKDRRTGAPLTEANASGTGRTTTDTTCFLRPAHTPCDGKYLQARTAHVLNGRYDPATPHERRNRCLAAELVG